MDNAEKNEAVRDPVEDSADTGNRREFIKKMAYVTPVMQTFLLSETAFGVADASADGRARGRGRTSPTPGQQQAPPPPPE